MAATFTLAANLGPRLVGRLSGGKAFTALLTVVSDLQRGETFWLDFSGVDVVTASWVSGAIVPLFRHAADQAVDIYPVLAGLPEELVEDFVLVAGQTEQNFPHAPGGPGTTVAPLGELDPSLVQTLRAVVAAGEATGAELARAHPGEKITPPAWNHRLRDLHRRRLLRRRAVGRRQIYSPAFEELIVHGD